MSTATQSIEQLAINTIRTLSMDAVQKANSGHPGTPMALAPVSYTIWNQFLKYDPQEPLWPARDRFVLSCGHASRRVPPASRIPGREVDQRVFQPNQHQQDHQVADQQHSHHAPPKRE